MIKVPACRPCNGGFAAADEEFRVYLSMSVGVDDVTTRQLWRSHALRSARHNRRLRERLLADFFDVEVTTPGGLKLARQKAVRWSKPAHNAFIERIVRGLFWHRFKKVLGYGAEIRVTVREADNGEFLQLVGLLAP